MQDTQNTCPVCGMALTDSTAAHQLEHEGTTYRFCCQECMDAFAKDPSAYVKA
ncbi:YHS domain-containing protein [Aestuariimicrobium ganziense]|uniref:YHS domain-containing protein n=1 Tax=Aestuariimicrobium ganziense TaxID=2773677 RepID=UPI0019459B7B|nr:YHS domain-containing protein [Aestuariimicrobium ganziense]